MAKTGVSPSSKSVSEKFRLWPPEVLSLYKPVKALGKGGFGEVWLGGLIQTNPQSDENDKIDLNYAAIKKVDTSTPMGKSYANREIKILQHLDHPHIVKLFQVFEIGKESPNNRLSSFIALSYAPGPTLEQIIDTGGAVGIPFSRMIAKQLISAVGYMHDHAVIHRDLKPDNVLVTGSSLDDDDIWDDGELGEKAVKDNKWFIVLIDFGFVRSLNQQDVEMDIALSKLVRNEDLKDLKNNHDFEDIDEIHYLDDSMDMDIQGSHGGKRKERGRRLSRDALDKSISHVRVRDLSAVGNRNFAAPEIMEGAHEKRSMLDRSISKVSAKQRNIKKREALAEFVSSYGMDADAYSLGLTFRYAFTGVPPGYDVNEYIANQNSFIADFVNALFSCMKSSKKNPEKKKKRKKQYRVSSKCPKQSVDLIRGLTQFNPGKRTTVRAARYHPWVNEGKTVEVPKNIPVKFLDVDV